MPVAIADVMQHLLIAAHGAHTCHKKAADGEDRLWLLKLEDLLNFRCLRADNLQA